MFHWFVGSEWIWWKELEHLFLESMLPPVLILGVGRGLVRRLWLSSDVTVLCDMVERILYSFLQLDVRLSSWVTLCLRRCLYRRWEICSLLMNTVQRHPHCSWGLWRVSFGRNWCMIWGCRSALFWWRRDDDCSSWPLGERRTQWGIHWLPPRCCGKSGAAKSRINPMPYLSDWREVMHKSRSLWEYITIFSQKCLMCWIGSLTSE